MLNKENCSVQLVKGVNKDTGEEYEKVFISHPKFKKNLSIIGRDDEGEDLDASGMISAMKANPNWRASVVIDENQFGWYARLSGSTSETLDL